MNRSRSISGSSREALLPRDVTSLMELGKAAARAGRRAEARFYFRAVLEIAPDHPAALLWMAYLAGGGRSSLEYLVRVLEADPSNQRARAAIRWARIHAPPPSGGSDEAPSVGQLRRFQHLSRMLLGMIVLMLGLATGLMTAAFVLDLPPTTPTRVTLAVLPIPGTIAPIDAVAQLPSVDPASTQIEDRDPTATATPLSSTTAPTLPSFSATPTDTPRPVASPLPLPSPTPSASPTATEGPPTATATAVSAAASSTPLPTVSIGENFRWIDVDLTHQLLTAYEGQTPLRWIRVSTGLPRTPTVTGRFKIYVKYKAAPMSGPGYYLPGVPYVMYFYRGYGIHGTYWHDNFGQPMSHGCVNLPTPEAEWLFNWASVGTLVVVHY